jgi:membrane associated rhomboid family serine protease
MIFSKTIPDWITENYVIIPQNAPPNIFAMFLSNFAHMGWAHLLENMGSYVILVCSIVIMIKFIIPFFNTETYPTDIFDPKTLVNSSILFFVLVPFFIAAESVIFLYLHQSATGVVGFSGIGFAFEGYLVYLMEMLIFWKIVYAAITKRRPILAVIGILLLLIMPIFVLGNQFNTMVTSNLPVNYGAHLVGFILGITIPYLLDRKRINGEFT